MSQVPNVLQPDTSYTDNLSLINDNFSKVVEDLRDLGGDESTTTDILFTVSASSLSAQTVALISQEEVTDAAYSVKTQSTVGDIAALSPIVRVRIDVDDDAHLWINGASLTSDQLNVFIGVTVSATFFTNAIGGYTIQINNRDSSDHTYYVHTSCNYVQRATGGQFR